MLNNIKRNLALNRYIFISIAFTANAWSGNAWSTDTYKSSPYTKQLAQQLSKDASIEGVVDQTISTGTSIVEDKITSEMKKWIPTFEISLTATSHGKPVYSVLGLVPLFETDNHLFFTQDSVFYNDDRRTVNIGLGYRNLSLNDKLLVGVNAFYDHEFPYDHARTSFGAEIRTTVAELNTNYYNGQTGWKPGANGLEERAMGGYDIEAGFALPYIPNSRLYAKHFQWDAFDGATDLAGNTYALNIVPYDGVLIEGGKKYFTGLSMQDTSFIQLRIDLIKVFDSKSKSKPLFSNKAYELSSMREYRYDRVRRENIIQKQTRGGTGFTASVSGI